MELLYSTFFFGMFLVSA